MEGDFYLNPLTDFFSFESKLYPEDGSPDPILGNLELVLEKQGFQLNIFRPIKVKVLPFDAVDLYICPSVSPFYFTKGNLSVAF